MREITIDDYVLTNIQLSTGYFTIRLKDNKEYVVYKRKGCKDFIEIDGKEVPLSDKVLKMHLSSIREYQVNGI